MLAANDGTDTEMPTAGGMVLLRQIMVASIVEDLHKGEGRTTYSADRGSVMGRYSCHHERTAPRTIASVHCPAAALLPRAVPGVRPGLPDPAPDAQDRDTPR